MRRGRHQEVTGLTVNERVAVPRETLRRFRALLHRIDKNGPEGRHWGKAHDVFDAALGFAFFVRMVSPAIGDLLIAEVRRLADRHGKSAKPVPEAAAFRAKSARGEAPLARWWAPADREPPKPEPILVQPPKPEPAAASTPRSAIGVAAGMRARMQQEGPGGAWNQGTASSRPSLDSQTGPRAALRRASRRLYRLLGVLLLLGILANISPKLAVFALIFLVGYFGAEFFRKR
jgi:hypothetical protein